VPSKTGSESWERGSRPQPWIKRTVIEIMLATFFSDFNHEMATAVLP
jgi:hypothetical protein